jgi:hypothetical protein
MPPGRTVRLDRRGIIDNKEFMLLQVGIVIVDTMCYWHKKQIDILIVDVNIQLLKEAVDENEP